MSPKKISPAIPLAVGVLCIGAALVGGVVAYMEEAEAEKKPKAKTTAEAPVRRLKKAKGFLQETFADVRDAGGD